MEGTIAIIHYYEYSVLLARWFVAFAYTEHLYITSIHYNIYINLSLRLLYKYNDVKCFIETRVRSKIIYSFEWRLFQNIYVRVYIITNKCLRKILNYTYNISSVRNIYYIVGILWFIIRAERIGFKKKIRRQQRVCILYILYIII